MTIRTTLALSLLLSVAVIYLAGCSNKGVTIPNNTAAAAVPPSPQVTNGSPGSGNASSNQTGGNPSFAK